MSHPRARINDLLTQPTGEDLVVFDQQRNIAHTLNRTAALVFQHANGTRSVALRSEQGFLSDISVICHHLTMHLPSSRAFCPCCGQAACATRNSVLFSIRA